jgi:predicted dehydrogenase
VKDGLIRVGVVGAGYWGSKLARICHESPSMSMIGTADPVGGDVRSIDELIDREVEAVIIATPATTHEALVARALKRHLHVLVEKPMALSGEVARDLVWLAAEFERVLMVDHTYVYSPALDTVRAALLDLGPVYAMHSARMHMGGPEDVSSLWDLLPHDLSILASVAPGWWQGLPEIEVVGDGEAGLMTLWWGARTCRVQYSRRSPTKVRHFSFGTAEGEIRWSDWPTARVVLDRHGLAERELPVPAGEPLRRSVEAFAEAIITGECGPTAGASAVRIVDVIEAATARLAIKV